MGLTEKILLSVPETMSLLTMIFSVPNIMPSLHLTPRIVLKGKLETDESVNQYFRGKGGVRGEEELTWSFPLPFQRILFGRFCLLGTEKNIRSRTNKG